MAREKTDKAQIAKLLAVALLLSLTGTGLTQATEVEHQVPPDGYVPQFGPGFSEVEIASNVQGLEEPRDLEFHPSPQRASELWVVNRATDSATIIQDAGNLGQTSETRQDAYGYHFMEEVSAIAFGADHVEFDYQFATAQESRNTYNGQGDPNDFMGPALWPSSLDHYAVENQESGGLLGSHLDMLHESPLGMGVAHDVGNAYWYNDGFYGELVHYDFNEDHDTGEDDHSDGVVKRYTEINLTRVADVPGHMDKDQGSGILYIADTGGGRVLWVNTSDQDTTVTDISGSESQMEVLAEYSEVTDVEWGVLSSGLSRPSGLVVHENKVFVSQNGNNRITAYNLDETGKAAIGSRTMETNASSIMGLEIGPSGKLWYVDAEKDVVVRLDPHPDRDYDEVRDSLDAYPDNHLLWSDQDGDGYADQPGTPTSDDCPQAGGTSSIGLLGCPDSDNDGRADLSDEYPEDETQWADTDGDGYGDNPSGIDPDRCPYTSGYSEHDRKGCPDTDEDGYSDPTPDWTSDDGADAFPSHDSQWSDTDSDGYGDNPAPAYLPDDCPQSWGSSSEDKRGCIDSDGDGWSDDGDAFEGDTTQWRDSDSDGYGDNPSPATMPDSCPSVAGNSSIGPMGCPDGDGDGWSDEVDSHPDSNLMWSDSDGDGFSDQQAAPLSDDCPDQWGKSDQDRSGCPDGDGDGWSDEGDFFPSDPTRHSAAGLLAEIGVGATILAVTGLYLYSRR